MAAIPLDYAPVPYFAVLLPQKDTRAALDQSASEPKQGFSLEALNSSVNASGPSEARGSHNRNASAQQNSFSFTNMLINSALNLPSTQGEVSPRGPAHALLSSRDPLSIPITTTNFRRFVGKVGFIFWLMDRAEEIIMWRKGWKYTSSWIVLFAALCEPR